MQLFFLLCMSGITSFKSVWRTTRLDNRYISQANFVNKTMADYHSFHAVHSIRLCKLANSSSSTNKRYKEQIIKQIINNYWMRLSGISRIIEAEVRVICRSRRLRQVTLTEASIILDIPRKPNSIIILLFTWTVLSFTWTILLFTWADTKIMI